MKLGANEKAGPITDFLLGDHGDWELANRTFQVSNSLPLQLLIVVRTDAYLEREDSIEFPKRVRRSLG